jgi:hypothetical protein
LRLAAGLIVRGGVGLIGQFGWRRGNESGLRNGRLTVALRARPLGRIRCAPAMFGDHARSLARADRLIAHRRHRCGRRNTIRLAAGSGGNALQIHDFFLGWKFFNDRGEIFAAVAEPRTVCGIGLLKVR